MGFAAIEGQEPAVETLTRALQSGRLHHAYRFEGPSGIGKEMAAFALAQALVCEAPTPLACERCSACRRAVTLSSTEPEVPLHPDVVLVGRGLYRQSVVGASEATGISVEQVRRIVLGRAGFGPHEGRALVFIVRDADELTVQAANALLKTLEEPISRTHFILLTHRPNRLLDTIRSRTLAVLFRPLGAAVISRILERHGLPPAVSPLAQGSASLALELASTGALERTQGFTDAAMAAINARDLAQAIALAADRPAGRDELRGQLGYLAMTFAEESRALVRERPDQSELAARRYQIVLEAMAQAEANVQPALVIESMVARLRAA
jgi:DNA polymerase-3 subunit delta'